jgi:hypothetical protein
MNAALRSERLLSNMITLATLNPTFSLFPFSSSRFVVLGKILGRIFEICPAAHSGRSACCELA